MPISASATLLEEQAEQLRAAATDCARAADDYEREGFGALANRFRVHAAALWQIAQPRKPPMRAPRAVEAAPRIGGRVAG